MFSAAKKLRRAGVLGLNERNAEFITRLNPRRLFPRVDDKVLTKELALAAGMAVPELYGVISNQAEVRAFANTLSSTRVIACLSSVDSRRWQTTDVFRSEETSAGRRIGSKRT